MNSAQLDGFWHVFVPEASPSEPTLVLFHGTGGDEADLIGIGQRVLPGANLIGVRGRSLEEGLNRFFRRYAEGVFDEHDIRLQADGLASFLASVKTEYGLTGPFVALGYSNGANIVAAMLLLGKSPFSTAVLLRPMLPLLPEERPDLRDVEVLVVASERDDPAAPSDSRRELVVQLSRAGALVHVELVSTGHGLSGQDVMLAEAWLNARVKAQKSLA